MVMAPSTSTHAKDHLLHRNKKRHTALMQRRFLYDTGMMIRKERSHEIHPQGRKIL